MKLTLNIKGPILPGSISTAKSRCGKQRCVCKSKQPKLHGTYYRWTGAIEGRRTTKTISMAVARECKERIDRYKQFQKQMNLLLRRALRNAPWASDVKRS